MLRPDEQELARYSAIALAEGDIPFGRLRVPIGIDRETMNRLLADKLVGGAREWTAGNSRWDRYSVNIEILWYPRQTLFLIFKDDKLLLVSFNDPRQKKANWDYQIELDSYVCIKQELMQYLGKESKSDESVPQNMSARWEYNKLSIYLACDAKTGGCGLGIQSNSLQVS
jgi:hypothetical protein